MSWPPPPAAPGAGGGKGGKGGYGGGYQGGPPGAGGKGFVPPPRNDVPDQRDMRSQFIGSGPAGAGAGGSFGPGGSRGATGGGAPPPAPARNPTRPGGTTMPPPVQVSGCTNPTVCNIIRGSFLPHGANHGKPVYRKEGHGSNVSVLIYYWDERDGPSFCGWWFGPKVGGDQVWAYNGNKASAMPPSSNWKVPWDGPVDDSLRLSIACGQPGQPGQPQQPVLPPQGQHGPPPSGQPSGRSYPSPPRSHRYPRERSRDREEDSRRRQEADRQRAEADQRRRDDERREREEDSRRREKAKAEEQSRLRRKREEDEARKKEQAAALEVRKVVQRVRGALPETYDGLRAELEECLARNLEAMGTLAEKVSQEAASSLTQQQKRIDEINEQRAEDERRRLEDEKRRKEEAELCERLMKEASGEVKEAEDKVTEAQDQAKALSQQTEGPPESVLEAATAAEKALEVAKYVLEDARRKLDDKQREMGDTDAAHRARRDIADLRGRLSSGLRTADNLAYTVSSTREKAKNKAVALKKERDRKAHFEKHDQDKDGSLSREEVVSFGKVVHDFEPCQEVLDKIMRILEPVTYEKFHYLHRKYAIAKSEVQARARRAEQEERARQLEEHRLVIQAVLNEAAESLRAVEEILAGAESKAKPLTWEHDLPANEIRELATAAEGLTKRAEDELKVASSKLQKVEAECEADEGLKDFTVRDMPQLQQWHDRGKGRTEKVLVAVEKAREQAVQKEYAETDHKWAESVTAIRAYMTAEGKTGEQLFAHIDAEGSSLTREKFVAFLKGLPDLALADGQAEKLYEHVAGTADGISKERFLESIQLYYKCVKSTVLSEELTIKSKTVRRLDLGEILEALEGPAKEESASVQRVRCQSVQDGATGWVTIAGNQGTSFLEPGGNLFSCVKETLLTDGLSVSDSKTIRRVAKGEVIEVLEFHKKDAATDIKRIKGKAKLDGAMGWVTQCSNQGTIYLEPC